MPIQGTDRCLSCLTGVDRLPIMVRMATSELFEVFYRENYNRILNYARVVLREVGLPQDLAEDAMQEVYIRAGLRYAKCSHDHLVALCCTIARYWVISQVRLKANQALPLPSDSSAIAFSSADALEALVIQETHARLSDCVGQLSAQEQKIVQAKIEGLKSKIIGEQIGLPAETVDMRYYRIRKQLSKCMDSKAASVGGEAI